MFILSHASVEHPRVNVNGPRVEYMKDSAIRSHFSESVVDKGNRRATKAISRVRERKFVIAQRVSFRNIFIWHILGYGSTFSRPWNVCPNDHFAAELDNRRGSSPLNAVIRARVLFV